MAYVATKLCLGKDLVSIRNSVNMTTTACFEPSLDYCVVKVPRWDLKKFNLVSTRLGSSMTSVGEVMAIGRCFEEAIQKACRMVTGGSLEGLEGDSFSSLDRHSLDELLRIPTDRRLYAVQAALERGYTIEEVSRLSHIDRWFLSKLRNISHMKAEAKKCSLDQLGYVELKTLKCNGFSDRQIARYTGSTELVVRRRRQQIGLIPWCKQIDTLAAEYPAHTNYLYMTYNGSEHDIAVHSHGYIAPKRNLLPRRDSEIVRSITDKTQLLKRPRLSDSHSIHSSQSVHGDLIARDLWTAKPSVIVLGCGAYSIGSSVEFDWCAVSCLRQLRALGTKAIVINYNPETVSTDYDESDALYFEELTFERVMDVYELERAEGIVVSVGGQIPNNLSYPLHQQGARILGTSAESIDRAEDRHKFSALLDMIEV